ncbi:MAG: hypothetical protein ACFB5Z_16220 [Elainellaceae cyanobacterium]
MDSATSIWGNGAATVLVNRSRGTIAGSTLGRRGPLRSLRWPTPNLSSLVPSPSPALPYLHIGLDNISGEGSGIGPGEFLLVTRHQVQRLATFRPIPILSQGKRSYHPWQITYAYLTSTFDWDDLQTAYGSTDLLQFLGSRTQQMNRLLTETVKAPWSSSCSYLCDAVAAAIGLYRQQAAYSGQGGLALRKLLTAKAISSAEPYPLKIRLLYQKEQPIPYLEPRPMWEQLLEDLQADLPAAAIAGRFYLGLIEGISEMVRLLAETHPISHVALSGRLLQHPMLTYRLKRSLAEMTPQFTRVA